MRISSLELLNQAQAGEYAIGAFNVYNLEGVRAVIGAAESCNSPVILQIHPAALRYGGKSLVALCQTAAAESTVPVAVHLDHSTSSAAIQQALDAGIRSVMADGSHLSYEDNLAFARDMAQRAHQLGAVVEAELGRIGGSEDGQIISEENSRMTDPQQAAAFVSETDVDMLAVCIGNVHGQYHCGVWFDFPLLAAIRQAVDVPLVLHGASGVPTEVVRRCIEMGVSKFNVNTEVRQAYVEALRKTEGDLLDIMMQAIAAMQKVVESKLQLFGSVGQVKV